MGGVVFDQEVNLSSLMVCFDSSGLKNYWSVATATANNYTDQVFVVVRLLINRFFDVKESEPK